MHLSDLITTDAILPSLKASSKRALLSDLSVHAAKKIGTDKAFIFETLLEREQLGTTGLGKGVAIPHARMENLPGIIGFFTKLKSPINYDSVDKQPVDLVFLLLTPENAGADHLKALALISRFLKNQDVCAKLRACETSDAMYAVFKEFDDKM